MIKVVGARDLHKLASILYEPVLFFIGIAVLKVNSIPVWKIPEPIKVNIKDLVYDPILSAKNPTRGGAKNMVKGSTAYIKEICSTCKQTRY